jgi:membrane protein DedA with SNARE-associated domain
MLLYKYSFVLIYSGREISSMQIIDQIREFLANLDVITIAAWGIWSYLVLAILVALEGPIATLLGAAAASLGLLHPGFVFVAAAIGNLTSDTLWYYLGYIGKIEWIQKLSKRLGVSEQKLQALEKTLHDHAPIILFISKLTVSPMIPALIATGLIKYPWRKWFPFVFMGEMIWTGSLVVIGFFGLIAIKKVQLGIEHAILIGSLIFIVTVFILGRRFLRREIQVSTDPPKEASHNEE